MSLAEYHERGMRSTCELAFYAGIPCRWPLHAHHVLSKTMLLRSPGALALVETAPWYFLATVCEAHNVGRWADGDRARALLVQSRVAEYGAEPVRRALEAVVARMKVKLPGWTLEGLLAPL